MTDIPVEQAIYGNAGGYRFLARSPGFIEEWLPVAEQLCTGFGERPAGVACPYAVFAQPFGPDHVAVVQVADQGNDDAGRPGALGFHILVIPRRAYTELIGDPFAVAARYPAPWLAREELPTLAWPVEAPPQRTVAEVQRIIKRPESAELLGGAQALVDGGKVVFERSAPATDLLRDLWALLPTRTRCFLWPASFAFDNTLGFHVLAAPKADPVHFDGYLSSEQAAEYPQGRYELNVQIAAEAGDQAALDALFARRSSADTLKLALILIVVVGALAVVTNVMSRLGDAPPTRPTPAKPTARTTPPLLDRYKSIDHREEVGDALRKLLKDLKAPLPRARPTIPEMLDALDKRLGTPDPTRYPGPLDDQGDLERRLRVLLWKNHVERFDDPALSPLELIERLREKVVVQAKKDGT